MNFFFHPDAAAEFLASIEYYEDCSIGLGLDFAVEVHEAIEHIVANPFAWPQFDVPVRRCLVSRFPYGVLYVVDFDTIYILAVMYLHREPEYWKVRLPKKKDDSL